MNKNSSRVSLKTLFSHHGLFALFACAVFLRLLIAIVFPSMKYPDAIFQTLEPAHHLAFGYGILSWEWHTGIRSYVFPGVLAFIMKMCSWVTSAPLLYIIAIQIFMVAFSIIPVYVAYRLSKDFSRQVVALVAAGIPAFWYGLVYYAPITLNGALPAYLFVLCCLLIIRNREQNEINIKQLILIGGILGVVSFLRFHLLPEVLVAAIYCCKDDFLNKVKYFLLGFLILFVPLGFVDAITLTYPFQSIWLNFYVNIVQHVSSTMGIDPWYYYLQELAAHLNVFLIPLVYLSYLGAKKQPLFLAVAIVSLLSFSLIKHKEYRFIYLGLICLLVSASLGFAYLVQHKNISMKKILIMSTVFIVINMGLLLHYARANENPYIPMAYHLHHQLTSNQEKKTSGIVFSVDSMFWTAGYTYLNVNIPLHFTPHKCTLSDKKMSRQTLIITNHSIKKKGVWKVYSVDGLNEYATHYQVIY